MTSQYLNHLYSDLLSNSPQTVTIDIPASMGTGQISQIVTKQGTVVSKAYPLSRTFLKVQSTILDSHLYTSYSLDT